MEGGKSGANTVFAETLPAMSDSDDDCNMQQLTDLPAFIDNLDPACPFDWTIGLDGLTLELLFDFDPAAFRNLQPNAAQLNFLRNMHAQRQGL